MPAIVAEQVSKSYRYTSVLHDVSFSVEPGQCFVLFGANGAGKTTLLRILTTIQRPSGGRFFIAGFDGVTQRQDVRDNIFLVTHGSHLYDELSGAENLRFALGLRGMHPDAAASSEALARVGLDRFADLKARYYSSGMKKRLAFAKAMLIRPKVLFLDEPYAALDEKAMDMINGFIHELMAEGGAVLMCSHNRHKSSAVASRAGVLRRGVMGEVGVAELRGDDEIL